jgi:NitT/TauT family transport system ATP-binding protein
MMGMSKTQKGCQIVIDNLTVVYNERKKIEAVRNLNLEVKPGEFLCILGVSGCGKSTILNVVAGFVKPTLGEVLVDGERVKSPNPSRGMVFQQHALFPWLSVLGNVQFGPRSLGIKKKESKKIARKYIELVGLSDFSSLFPDELSGGMQQRVGLARALANDPQLLLMDEPFGSLDAQTRSAMQELLLKIWHGTGKTVIFVTHDVDEAIFLADNIVVLTARPGEIKAIVPVLLPRQRKYDMVTSEAYLEIKREVLSMIRDETLKVINYCSLQTA